MTITDADVKRLSKRLKRRGPREQIRLGYRTVPIRKKDTKVTLYKTKIVML